MGRGNWIGGCVVVLVLAFGCGDSADDGAAGNGGTGNACVDNGVANGLNQACASCGCTKCAAQVNNCQDAACQAVLTCGINAGCTGNACYCGAIDALACVQGASGPCMDVIVNASGMLGQSGCASVEMCAIGLTTALTDPANPVTRANAVSTCTSVGTPAMMDAMGNVTAPAMPPACAAECM